MMDEIVVYGGVGSGSVPIEATLRILKIPYRVEQSQPWRGSKDQLIAGRVNPLRQVPSVVFSSGEVMTESAAILIWLADANPDARLAPGLRDPARPEYLRWMAFIATAIYPLYRLTDDPSRWVDGELEQRELRRRAVERIAECWRVIGAQANPRPWLVGENMSVLDLYVSVVSRWTPRRKRFYAEAPRLTDLVRRVDELSQLREFWKERFPFEEGWEG